MSSQHEKGFLKSFLESPLQKLSDDIGEANEWELDLGVMILRLQDDTLDSGDFEKLEKQITTDSRALNYYVEFVNICAGLHALLGKKRDFAGIRSLLPA